MARSYEFPEILMARSDTGSHFGFNYKNGSLLDTFVCSSGWKYFETSTKAVYNSRLLNNSGKIPNKHQLKLSPINFSNRFFH